MFALNITRHTNFHPYFLLSMGFLCLRLTVAKLLLFVSLPVVGVVNLIFNRFLVERDVVR